LKDIKAPWDNYLLKMFLRPRIFLDLTVNKSMDICHLEFQLYSEAAPQVVFDFIRAFKNKDFERVRVLRGFKSLWLDCELLLDENGVSRDELEYDADALQHEKQMGILSISQRFLDGFKTNLLNFSISFRPLYIQKGHRIAFGRIISGFRGLSKLEEVATMKGGLKKMINVVDCGLIVDTSPYTDKCKYLSKLEHLKDI